MLPVTGFRFPGNGELVTGNRVIGNRRPVIPPLYNRFSSYTLLRYYLLKFFFDCIRNSSGIYDFDFHVCIPVKIKSIQTLIKSLKK